ncbi:MAG: 5-formyltetrahydrofolate cyclo-ligase [Spirochaetales bacterium]|nr:5-formyltetrahydrofolate cyclo-ligase [Spirochaetales bacterium]
MLSKKELREEILSLLADMGEEAQRGASRNLCAFIESTPLYQEADALFAFYPFLGEIDLRRLMNSALTQGKTLCLPRVEGREMSFYRVESLEEEKLEPNRWGIFEPLPGAPLCEGGAFKAPLMLVPGLAFTKEGKRLGRGGGYYDRYLERERNSFSLAGVAYPCQMVKDIPTEAHDILLNRVYSAPSKL